ncbi:MAG: FAD-dependent oxidoreductase [Deltaproteobacteria bacterium]|nr:FAD-dependent oxidoreductase [Deltaproteobacteria bacterium]
MKRRNVAIIGGGIAGLTAGYLINQKHDVTLFEKSSRIGGNAYTHISPQGDSMDVAVAAFGRKGYKNFFALLSELDIGTSLCPTSFMSLRDLDTHEGIYLTPTFKGIRKQKFQLLRASSLKMLMQVYLGLKKAQALLKAGEVEGLTLDECLQKIPQFKGDARTIFMCTLCLLSSMKGSDILNSPASFFLNKLKVHNDFLSPKALYSIRCVDGGTKSYVEALSASFRSKVIFNAQIKTVLRDEKGVTLVMKDGEKRPFDQVVFACNADQALPLIESPTDAERKILGAWRYYNGRLAVHRDYSSFPPRDLMQAYTFLYTNRNGVVDTSVSGSTWHQSYVSKDCEYIGTQHPNFPIRDELIELDLTLRTPIYDFSSYPTIQQLPTLNGEKNSFFCGSYFGYGLHEDAVSSAIDVAKFFDVTFQSEDAPPKIFPALREVLKR